MMKIKLKYFVLQPKNTKNKIKIFIMIIMIIIKGFILIATCLCIQHTLVNKLLQKSQIIS